MVLLAACGRIGFGENASGVGSNDANPTGDGAGTSYDPVDPTLCLITDTCSPCTTSSTQMFGSYTGGVSVANTGSGWAVAYSDNHPETYVARFDATGTQIGMPTKVTNNTGQPLLAWSGAGYGLMTDHGINATEVINFGALDATDAPVGSVQLTASAGIQLVVPGAIVASSSGYGALWWIWNTPSQQGLYLASLTSTGTVNKATLFGTDYANNGFSLVWNGNEFGVVYSISATNGPPIETHLARFDAGANLLGDTLMWTSQLLGGFATVMDTRGTTFAVAWIDGTNMMFATYSADGTPMIAPRIIATTLSESSVESLVVHGSGYALAWGSTDGDTDRVTDLLYLDVNGTPTTPVLQFGMPSIDQQFDGALTSSGSDLVVTWADDNANMIVMNIVSCP
jgi:hypothetical protein